ncbi:hypothetical protein DFJ77DRAFT_451843 [Powellomyces hirtus]|nr:hypothetical protein DFJ77DRAFT_451843 [Powellomyces hirtus]
MAKLRTSALLALISALLVWASVTVGFPIEVRQTHLHPVFKPAPQLQSVIQPQAAAAPGPAQPKPPTPTRPPSVITKAAANEIPSPSVAPPSAARPAPAVSKPPITTRPSGAPAAPAALAPTRAPVLSSPPQPSKALTAPRVSNAPVPSSHAPAPTGKLTADPVRALTSAVTVWPTAAPPITPRPTVNPTTTPSRPPSAATSAARSQSSARPTVSFISVPPPIQSPQPPATALISTKTIATLPQPTVIYPSPESGGKAASHGEDKIQFTPSVFRSAIIAAGVVGGTLLVAGLTICCCLQRKQYRQLSES